MNSSTVHVSSTAELMAALEAADGSTTILMEGGAYGDLSLSAEQQPFAVFSAEVTIKSADPGNPASFSGMDLNGVQNLTFDAITFDYQAESGAEVWLRPFNVENSSQITIRNSTFDGDLAEGLGVAEDGYGTGTGLRVKESSQITVENNEFYNFKTGVGFAQVTDLNFTDNDIHHIRSDFSNFIEVKDVLIEGNYFHEPRSAELTGDHEDMIQFWTANTDSPTENVIIRGNVLDSGDGNETQSIFMRNNLVDNGQAGEEMFYRNIVIEDNVIHNAQTHGITVGETDGLVISNNTLLQNKDSGDDGNVNMPAINVAEASTNVTVTDNIATRLNVGDGEGWTVSNNLIVQRDDPDAANYVGDLFVNALADSGATIDDLRAIPGGLIEELGVGAAMTRELPADGAFGYLSGTAGEELDALTHEFSVVEAFDDGASLDLTGAKVVWSFGDGTTVTDSLTASHTFSRAGSYDVAAEITLGDGEVVTLRKTVEISSPIAFATGFGDEADAGFEAPEIRLRDGVVFEETEDGQALRISEGAATISSDAGFFGNSAYTMMFDFKKDTGAEAEGGRALHFSGSFVVDIQSDGISVSLTTTGGNYKMKAANVGIRDDEWHKVALTYSEDSGTAILYVDGDEAGRIEGIEGIQAGKDGQNLHLGNPWGASLPGLIDNVAFLRGAMDAEQVGEGMEFVRSLVSPAPESTPAEEADGKEEAVEPEGDGLDLPEKAIIDNEPPVFGANEAEDEPAPANEINGTRKHDVIDGTAEADRIDGDLGKDQIAGGAGNDVIDGGAHADTLNGEDGDDVIVGGHGGDLMTGGAGRDSFVFSNLSDASEAGEDVITDFKSGEDTLDFRNMGFTGFAAPGEEPGIDELTVRQDGNDTIIEHAHSEFRIRLQETSDFDQSSAKFAETGPTTTTGDDVVVFDSSWLEREDTGSFVFDLKDGNDTANLRSYASDAVDGGAGDDAISSGHGDDFLYGGLGNDMLSGEAHDDHLYGGEGDDVLVGGRGADTMEGGAGADRFVFDSLTDTGARDIDRIIDFTAGQDVLDVRQLGFVGLAAAGTVQAEMLSWTSDGTTTRLFNTETGFEIEFDGEIDFTADDFLF